MQPQVSEARLDGNVALVTGAGRGIGKAIAIELARRGATVVINYSRSLTAAEKVVEEIISLGSEGFAIQADISVPSEIEPLFEKVISRFGKLDIVVSNAGIEHFDPIQDVTPKDFDKVFGLNTRGQFFVAQQAYNHLSEGGRLILTSSISASVGIRNHAIYAGSKNAIEAFGRCLAKEFGDKKITVNVLAPGGVDTDMALADGYKYIPGADASWSMDDIRKTMSAHTPLGRMGLPTDIARVVAFLVSKDGGWINGQTITMSGGAGF